MQVRIISTNEIVEAKRFSELSQNELFESIGSNIGNIWNDDDIFVHFTGDEWGYVYDDEIEIL